MSILCRMDIWLDPDWTAFRKLAESQGASCEAIWKWRQRGHVPFKWRDRLLDAAREQRLPLRRDDLGSSVAEQVA
ncbi:MAG: hypothetical protein QNJ62_05035 [Methyloceanibacter sp.]|nr:hypothetical protein [Methyloceanibacter sp.]